MKLFFNVCAIMFTISLNQGFTGEEYSEKATITEGLAKDGAKITVKVDSLEYSIFQLIGECFKPYESMTCISNSCDEILHHSISADENGNIFMGLLPAVIGKTGGVCHIDILREGGSIHVKYPWGLAN